MAQTISPSKPSLWSQFTGGLGNLFQGTTYQGNPDPGYRALDAQGISIPGTTYGTFSSPQDQQQTLSSLQNSMANLSATPAGGGDYTLQGTQPDPYAAFGGRAAYDNLVSAANNQKQNIYGTANEAAANAGNTLRGNILDFLDSMRMGQSNIDRQGVQNELSRLQGSNNVRASVGRGVQSGGVVLNNKNASTSSASDALARAYGDIGRREMSKVGNQYAQDQNALQQTQADYGMQRDTGVRKFGISKDQTVNNIVLSARDKLAALDGQMAQASLPDRINIEQEREAIKAQVLGQLQQYDQLLSEGIGGIQGTSPDARRLEANRLATAGVAPDTSFNFTSDIPTEFQNTGPFASGLPIFTFPRKRAA